MSKKEHLLNYIEYDLYLKTITWFKESIEKYYTISHICEISNTADYFYFKWELDYEIDECTYSLDINLHTGDSKLSKCGNLICTLNLMQPSSWSIIQEQLDSEEANGFDK